MKPKIFKARRWWMWICRTGECPWGGKSEHWELAHMAAVEHAVTHKRKRIPHDNDMTPPGGIPRYYGKDAN